MRGVPAETLASGARPRRRGFPFCVGSGLAGEAHTGTSGQPISRFSCVPDTAAGCSIIRTSKTERQKIATIPRGKKRAGDMPDIRVVIGEDSYIVRKGIQEVLASRAGIEVVSAAGSYAGVLDAVEREGPDVVVTDIRMPPKHEDEGVRLASHLRKAYPAIGVVLLSQYTSPGYALKLLEDGSNGRAYLLKEHVATEAQLATAVETVASGGSVIDPVVVETLVERRAEEERSRVSSLTPREREVLAELAQGKSNAKIGAQLFLSKGAVEKHINSIFRKLDMPDEAAVHRRVYAALLFLADEDREEG
jgi:DNA-binding NarL/FixJ family response regulator